MLYPKASGENYPPASEGDFGKGGAPLLGKTHRSNRWSEQRMGHVKGKNDSPKVTATKKRTFS